MQNTAIRERIQRAGVYQWQVAEQLSVAEVTFIRWLRTPLPADKEARVIAAIEAARKQKEADFYVTANENHA